MLSSVARPFFVSFCEAAVEELSSRLEPEEISPLLDEFYAIRSINGFNNVAAAAVYRDLPVAARHLRVILRVYYSRDHKINWDRLPRVVGCWPALG